VQGFTEPHESEQALLGKRSLLDSRFLRTEWTPEGPVKCG
jgi:hypothetical protein